MTPEDLENTDNTPASKASETEVDFYKLEHLFEKLYKKQKEAEANKSSQKNLNFFRQEIALHNIEKETEVPIDKIRTLYKVYCSHQPGEKFKFWGRIRNLELGWSIFAAGFIGGITLVGTAVGFIFTLQQFNSQFLKSNDLKEAENKIEREKSVTAAWKTLSEYSGQKANYGRSEALERLASESISLDGIDVAGANLNRLDLSPGNLREIAKGNQSGIDKNGWFSLQWMTKPFTQDTETNELEDEVFASVERADFRGAQLQSSNLTNVVFWGTDFSPYFREEQSQNDSQAVSSEENSTPDTAKSTEEQPSENQEELEGCKVPEFAIDVKKPTHREKTNFTKAILVGADFTNAKLDYADLTKADLSNANLTKATLSNAEVEGANFSGIDDKTDCLETLANQLLGRDAPGNEPDPTFEARNWRSAIYPYALREQEGLCGEVFFAVDKTDKNEHEKDKRDDKTSPHSNVVLIPEGIEDNLSDEQTTNRITVEDLEYYFKSGQEDDEDRVDLRCYGLRNNNPMGSHSRRWADSTEPTYRVWAKKAF